MLNTPQRRQVGRPEGRTAIREEILEVGAKLFSEYGYEGTSMRSIAKRRVSAASSL